VAQASWLGSKSHGIVLYSSHEPSELLQWLCHDDSSTINIFHGIITIPIITIILL